MAQNPTDLNLEPISIPSQSISSSSSTREASSLLTVPEIGQGKHSRESSDHSSQEHSIVTVTDIDVEEKLDICLEKAEEYKREVLELTLVDSRSLREKLEHFINAIEIDIETSRRNEFNDLEYIKYYIPRFDKRLDDFHAALTFLKATNKQLDDARVPTLLPKTKEVLQNVRDTIDLSLEDFKNRFPNGLERVDPSYIPINNLLVSRDYLLNQCEGLLQTDRRLKSFDLDLIVNYFESYKQSKEPWIDPAITLLTDREIANAPQPLQSEPIRVLQVVQALQNLDFLVNELPSRIPVEQINQTWISSLTNMSEHLKKLESGMSTVLPWAIQKNWLDGLTRVSYHINSQIAGVLNQPKLPEARDLPERFTQLELDIQKRILNMQERLLSVNPAILKQSLDSQYHLLNAQIALQTNLLKRRLQKDKQNKDALIKLLNEKNFDELKKSSLVQQSSTSTYMVDSLKSSYAQLSSCASLRDQMTPLQGVIGLEPLKQPHALYSLRLEMLSKKEGREGANRLARPIVDELRQLNERGELSQEEFVQRQAQLQKELNIKWTLICLTRLTENAVRRLPEEKQQIEDGLFEQLREQAGLTSEEVDHFKSLQRQDRRNFRKNVEITYMPENLEALEKIRTELRNHEEKLTLMTPLGKKPHEKNVNFSDTSQMARILDTEDEPEVLLEEGSSTENTNELSRVDSVMEGQIQEEKADAISIASSTKSIISISETASINTEFDKDQRYPESKTKSGDHASVVTEEWNLRHTDEIIRQAKAEAAAARETAREAEERRQEALREAAKITRWENLERDNQPAPGGEITIGSKFSSNSVKTKAIRKLSKEIHNITGFGSDVRPYYRLPEGSTYKLLEGSSVESLVLDPNGPFRDITARPPVGHPALEKLLATNLDELPFHWLPDDGRRSVPANSCVFFMPAIPNGPEASFLFHDRQQNMIIRVPAHRIDNGRQQELHNRLQETTPELPHAAHGQFSCAATGQAIPTGFKKGIDSVRGRKY